MFAPGLAMLWESDDPRAALEQRFGLTGLDPAVEWLTAVLAQGWDLPVVTCVRLLISSTNALAWISTQRASHVVKITAHQAGFARLDAIASLLASLEREGLPVAAPLPASNGARRVEAHTDRPLSVAVLPLVDGDLLDVGDLDAVRATGELVAHLHVALAGLDPTPFGAGRLDWGDDVRGALGRTLERPHDEASAPARAHLAELLRTLPELDRPRQLVHGDVRGANVLVRDHGVAALLDFDELGRGHPTVELAAAAAMLATEFRRWPAAPVPAQEALIDGYEQVLPLSDVERGWCTAARIAICLSQVGAGGTGDWTEAANALG